MHWKLHVYPKQLVPAVDIQQYCGSMDASISEKYTATFIAAKQHGVIVGIVAGHLTTPFMYRIRGLHVVEIFDSSIVASHLLGQVYSNARALGAKSVWALPDVTGETDLLLANGFVLTDVARDGRQYLIKSL